jgi:hypothetical protein
MLKQGAAWQRRAYFACCLGGLLLRLGLLPFTMHVDARFIGDIVTFPSAMQTWNGPERQNRSFLYPPLFYHTLSAYLHLTQPFISQEAG